VIDCGARTRPSAVSEITTEDGTVRTVPAATLFLTATKAPNLFNGCSGIEPNSLSDIDIAAIESMDAGGSEEFVAFIFADNYYELYVNGQLIAVDPVVSTPLTQTLSNSLLIVLLA